jgi:hypothetical protein
MGYPLQQLGPDHHLQPTALYDCRAAHGRPPRIQVGPDRLASGDPVSVESVEETRTYGLGETIVLSAPEFAQVAWTFVGFGVELENAVGAFQARRWNEQEVDSDSS